MAGLVAAARACELGADVVVHEKGDRPGGSMLLSSGVVWRFRDWERFRAECPGGDPELQRVVWEGLDDALEWLERLGAPVVARETGNPLTSGLRFDPGGLTEALVRRVGDIRLREPLTALPDGVPAVLATGGFQGDRALVRERITSQAGRLVLRANPWSSGDGLRLAVGRGAELSAGLDEFYGRNLAPAPRTASMPPAPTRAGSRRAGGRARSPPPSSSARSRLRRLLRDALEVRAGAVVLREGRGADLRDREAEAVVSDFHLRAGLRRLAVALHQLVAGWLRDEEQVLSLGHSGPQSSGGAPSVRSPQPRRTTARRRAPASPPARRGRPRGGRSGS